MPIQKIRTVSVSTSRISSNYSIIRTGEMEGLSGMLGVAFPSKVRVVFPFVSTEGGKRISSFHEHSPPLIRRGKFWTS